MANEIWVELTPIDSACSLKWNWNWRSTASTPYMKSKLNCNPLEEGLLWCFWRMLRGTEIDHCEHSRETIQRGWWSYLNRIILYFVSGPVYELSDSTSYSIILKEFSPLYSPFMWKKNNYSFGKKILPFRLEIFRLIFMLISLWNWNFFVHLFPEEPSPSFLKITIY